MTNEHATRAAGYSLPYLVITDERYNAHVARTFTVAEPAPGTVVLRGPCPRCEAIIDIPLVDTVFRRSRQHGPGHDPGRSRVEPMLCTCEDEHPNRPTGRKGCGAYWKLILTRPEP
jgi:hypothetical protein